MKKIVIILVAILVLGAVAFSLVACNRATTQGQLSNFLVDHAEETFEYDVKNELTNETGTYIVHIKRFQKGATVEDFLEPIQNVEKGILVRGSLTVGTTVYETGCYFNLTSGTSLMVPARSYRVQTENGNETFRMSGYYDGATFHYEKVVGGNTSSGSIKVSGTYFDNNEFHQSLRTVSTYTTSFSFSFAVPLVSATENTSVSLTASCKSTEGITTPFTTALNPENSVNCYRVEVSRSTKVAGKSQILFYAVDDMKASNSELTIKHLLVELREPITPEGDTFYVVYKLKSATIN